MSASPLHRLFHLGAVGMMSDAQLLDRFASRRDEAAEAAFEELVIRHGPMVLRVCRGVLHDDHDAEDAFQAVFLVLASRAGSIRRAGSVASWLFGVAHRVATRARRAAARRRRLDRIVAERASEIDVPRADDPDREALHEEIDGLPERLRAPVVLCYLQGLTYAAAAHQLGTSEVAVRGRIARARERLRHRLTRRGVTIPAGLLVAGAAGQAQAAIPAALIHRTIRIATGFVAGHTAAALARGVLNSMLLNRVKVAVVLLCLGIGGGYWTWHAFAGAADEKGESAGRRPGAGIGRCRSRGRLNRPSPTGWPARCGSRGRASRSRGRSSWSSSAMAGRISRSRAAADGRFDVELPPGQARSWTLMPPAGYWIPNNIECDRDLRARARSSRPSEGLPGPSRRRLAVPADPRRGATAGPRRVCRGFHAERILPRGGGRDRPRTPDPPPDGGRITVYAMPHSASRDAVTITIERDAQFRPDAVAKMDAREGRVVLTDADGKTASLTGLDRLEPTIAGGTLVVRVDLPEPDFRTQATWPGGSSTSRIGPSRGRRWPWGSGTSKGSAMSGDPEHTVDHRRPGRVR